MSEKIIIRGARQHNLKNIHVEIPRNELTVITGLSAGMFGYLLQGMFDNVWYNYRIVFMFYIILALTASAVLLKREADKK